MMYHLQAIVLCTLLFSAAVAQDCTRRRSRTCLVSEEECIAAGIKLEQFEVCGLGEILPTDNQKSVDSHNNYRANEGASDMKFMRWNSDLAKMAEQWAQLCDFEHGQPDPNLSQYAPLGQNLYLSTSPVFDEHAAVTSWFDEKQYYTYSNHSCSYVCGHYTQVVWADSFEVGCGLAKCPVIKTATTTYTDAFYYVCNYGPAGNFVGERPYQMGPACTGCSSGVFYCSDDTFCRSKEECDDLGTCVCKADEACLNCANTTDACSCDCSPGYRGPTCADKCENLNENCVVNWSSAACAQNDYVVQQCPLMCGTCEADTDPPSCPSSAEFTTEGSMTATTEKVTTS